VQRRETSLLDFADERKKVKTSTPLMFLKGFGLGNCEEDVAKQLSSGLWVRMRPKGAIHKKRMLRSN
jgi:hypothetical protein